MEYKTVDTSTLEGIETAEKMLRDGWKIVRSGLFLVYFSRKKIDRKARQSCIADMPAMPS